MIRIKVPRFGCSFLAASLGMTCVTWYERFLSFAVVSYIKSDKRIQKEKNAPMQVTLVILSECRVFEARVEGSSPLIKDVFRLGIFQDERTIAACPISLDYNFLEMNIHGTNISFQNVRKLMSGDLTLLFNK